MLQELPDNARISAGYLPAVRVLRVSTVLRRSARGHQARETFDLLTKQTRDFIPPTLWPPNSPDLNPVDYKVRSVMQEKVYKKPTKNVDELRSCILPAWDELDQRGSQAVTYPSMRVPYVKAKSGRTEDEISQ